MNRDKLVELLASHLHEEWRKPRLLTGEHGTENAYYSPRLKDDGSVDIANTPYSKLPAKWQAENKAQAAAVMKSLAESKDIETIAAVVHEQWMKRNEWARESQPNLFVPYKELPEEEKEKDRVVVRAGIRILEATQ